MKQTADDGPYTNQKTVPATDTEIACAEIYDYYAE